MKSHLAGWFLLCLPLLRTDAESRLVLEIQPRAGEVPLTLFNTSFTTVAGEKVSLGRLDFLLSDFALQRPDGRWNETRDWQGYVSVAEKRTTLQLTHVPAENYTAVRFHVGLTPAVNHGDPSKIPAGHPLNPELNGLYWNWQHEYIFLALEGRWSGAETATPGGYAFHLATDRQLMTIELPVALDLTQDRTLRVAMDVSRLFNKPNVLKIAGATSTHSRAADAVAGKLRENVEQAFSVLSVEEKAAPENRATEIGPGLPPGAKPYRLTFSRVFSIPDLPRDNPLTEQGVALGDKLFHDPRLSLNNQQACATCHQPEHAFTDSPRRYSLGAEGAAGTRNAMPLFNLAWKKNFFWDGRAASLREQVRTPITDPREMHETLPAVVKKLAATPEYPQLFKQAFGSDEINETRLTLALEQFLLTRISCNSKFDQAARGETKLTGEESRGVQLFFTEYDPRTQQFGADCFHCHGGADFTNHRFANNGLDIVPRDAGRFAVTHDEADRGKFAVPSLRNVALTAPYMHDGRFATLEEVIEHYDHGVQRSATLDPNLAKHPESGLGLSDADKRALVAFLKTLTDAALPR